MSEWRNFIIYEKKLPRMTIIAKRISNDERVLALKRGNFIRAFNLCYYDHEKKPHVSIRFEFEVPKAKRLIRRVIRETAREMKFTWEEKPYRERALVRLAYAAGTGAANGALRVLHLNPKAEEAIIFDADLRMHMIHGFLNNLGLGYLSEMRSYGLAIYNYSSALMMKRRALAKVK
jgi:hypothetical protein